MFCLRSRCRLWPLVFIGVVLVGCGSDNAGLLVGKGDGTGGAAGVGGTAGIGGSSGNAGAGGSGGMLGTCGDSVVDDDEECDDDGTGCVNCVVQLPDPVTKDIPMACTLVGDLAQAEFILTIVATPTTRIIAGRRFEIAFSLSLTANELTIQVVTVFTGDSIDIISGSTTVGVARGGAGASLIAQVPPVILNSNDDPDMNGIPGPLSTSAGSGLSTFTVDSMATEVLLSSTALGIVVGVGDIDAAVDCTLGRWTPGGSITGVGPPKIELTDADFLSLPVESLAR